MLILTQNKKQIINISQSLGIYKNQEKIKERNGIMSRQYIYEGEVYAFDSLVVRRWKASTWATSPAKAIANLKYRFRNEYSYSRCTPLDMPGRLVAAQVQFMKVN